MNLAAEPSSNISVADTTSHQQRNPHLSEHTNRAGSSSSSNSRSNESRLSSFGKPTPQDQKQLNFTMASGRPIGDKTNSLTVGPRGPTLLQDIAYIDEIAHFDRERIPERVVHAKGNGAFGYFELHNPDTIGAYCHAALFNAAPGTKTPIAVRFSTVGGESGSSDTVRDPRGFAVKFYTSEGNFDIVGNNTPIFFIRDPMQFPSLIHSQKRHPQTHLKDADAFWDFLSLREESTHQLLFLFSDRGIPNGYRHMHGFGAHAFKVVNSQDEPFYVKFHFKSCQGIENLEPLVAQRLAGQDPDYAGRDLFDAIKRHEHPAWRLCFQVMSMAQADALPFNACDITKTWPHGAFPLHDIGRIVLDKNPTNYFGEIEQLAFCPANMVPGIEPSPDKLLQGRLFSYTDTQRYRLGVNFNDIPVNRPRCPIMNPTYRDGACVYSDNWGNMPNYYPNSALTRVQRNPKAIEHGQSYAGQIGRYDSSADDNYSQASIFWHRVLSAHERKSLADNLGAQLSAAQPHIRERMLSNLAKVADELRKLVRAKIDATLAGAAAAAAAAVPPPPPPPPPPQLA